MAINFEDQLGSLDDASLMDILGVAPPAPPVVPAVTQAPAVVAAPVAAPAPSPVVSAPAQQLATKPSLVDQILNQWKTSGYGSQIAGVPTADRASALANQLNAMGVTDLSQLGIGQEARYLGGDTRAKAGDIVDWSKYQGAPTQTYDYLTYGGKNLGYLGSATPAGVDQSLIQLMDPSGKGNVKFTPVRNADGSVSFQPKWEASSDAAVNAILGTMLMSALAPGLSNLLGGGVLGAAGAGAASGAIQAGVTGNDVLKGALTGGLGGGLGSLASGVINPLAAEAAKQVGGGTLGDIVSGAVKGAGTSATGALIGGQSIADALLSGGIGGGVSSGIGSIVGQSGLPPEVAKIATPALIAAAFGKDPATAALNAAIGQIINTAKTSGDVANAAAMTPTEAEDRQAAADVTDLINNLAFAPTPAPEPVVKPSPAPSPAPEPEYPQLVEPQTVEDLIQQITNLPPTPPVSEPPPAPEPAPASAPSIEDQLRAAGVDFGEQVAPEPAPAPTPEDIQTLLDEINAGTPSSVTGNTSAIDALINQADLSNTDWASLYAQPTTNPVTGETIVGGDVSQYAPQEMQIAPENLASYDRTMQDIWDKGGFTSQWQTVGSDRVMVQDDGSAIGLNTETGATYGLTPEQTQQMVDLGLLNTAQSGYLSAIGAEPTPAPVAPSGGAGGAPTKTAPAPTATTPTAAKSGLDLNSLLALMALMGGGQEQTPQQQLFNLGRHKSAEEIFGLKEPTTLADILRRRA